MIDIQDHVLAQFSKKKAGSMIVQNARVPDGSGLVPRNEGVAAQSLLRPAGARRFPVTDPPFGLDAGDVKRANREFAPREGPALVAIQGHEFSRELGQRWFSGVHGAIDLCQGLRHKGRHGRVDDWEAGLGRQTFEARAEGCRRRREGRGSVASV